MVETEAHGTTGSGNSALPTELQTLAKVGLLENQWRLVKPIGQGQSGVVWEAHDISLDRRVAVKVMHQATAESPGQVARFERETRVLATLEHPNLTPVLGSGRLGGRPFVVMRLLLGRTLAELMHARGGKLTEAEAAYCLLPVCDALAALHEAKVVHRDLKPSNVFVSDDGTVTLLDLGQAFETGSELTRTGEMHGNAEYLSPEQIAGRGVDPQSDVYALGCLLHELLLGRPPFTGELAEVLEQHGSAPRPTALALGSGPLAEVLVRMLQVDPRARPALGEVRAALVPFAPAQLQLPAMALPRTRTSDKHRVARGLSDTAIPAARVREGAAPLGAGAQAGTTRDRWQGQHAEDEPTTATERPVPREAPTDRDVALPREAATRRAGAERPEEPPTAPGLALPRLPPAAEEETRAGAGEPRGLGARRHPPAAGLEPAREEHPAGRAAVEPLGAGGDGRGRSGAARLRGAGPAAGRAAGAAAGAGRSTAGAGGAAFEEPGRRGCGAQQGRAAAADAACVAGALAAVARRAQDVRQRGPDDGFGAARPPAQPHAARQGLLPHHHHRGRRRGALPPGDRRQEGG
ncbi:MAG: protein kinase [Archangiaceae bacterium]|nr:protein kinase [Archangiaceae bacterium]